MKRLIPLILAVPLLLTGCAAEEPAPTTTAETETSTTPPDEPEIRSLSDTIKIGNTITISDIEIDTTGCDFQESPARDGVKFQLVATVENNSGQEIAEILWPSDFSFKDSDEFTVSALDVASPSEGPCSNDNPTEFNRMEDGEKRRAAVTLEAPANAQEMIYDTTLIAGAEPIRWDVSEEINGMEKTTPESFTANSTSVADAPAVEAPAPVTDAPAVDAPAQVVEEDVYVVECLFGTPGPSLMSDGTNQSTEYCGNQPGAEEYREAESNSGYTNDNPAPYIDPSTIPYADGGTCPAAVCGYGTDENGNPNPSSGEIQALDGCERGYITDPDHCARIYERFGY